MMSGRLSCATAVALATDTPISHTHSPLIWLSWLSSLKGDGSQNDLHSSGSLTDITRLRLQDPISPVPRHFHSGVT